MPAAPAAAPPVRVAAAGRAARGAGRHLLGSVEEERPQDRDNMVLVDSDDESDFRAWPRKPTRKEEELLVRPACRGGGRAPGGGAGAGAGRAPGAGRRR